MYVCTYVCIYVCMYVCMYIHVFSVIPVIPPRSTTVFPHPTIGTARGTLKIIAAGGHHRPNLGRKDTFKDSNGQLVAFKY